LVLEIIAELSPCPEPTVFLAAGTRRLQRFTGGSLEDLGKLIRQCVQELKDRGLVEIKGSQLVIAPARSAVDEDILDLKSDVELQPQSTREKIAESAGDQGILDLTAEHELQAQSVRQTSERYEDMLNLTAQFELHGDEHILDLTAELELQHLRPPKLDKAPTNQQSQTKDRVAGGPKRAPEPTREEIIAAMRRFMSDE